MIQFVTQRIAKGITAFAIVSSTLVASTFWGTAGDVAVAHADALAAPADARLSAEAQLIDAVNADRAANGLAPLAIDAELTDIARWRSDDMVARDYFSHDIGGYQVFTVMKDRGIGYRLAGENLAYNYQPLNKTVAAAEVALMNSPSHRANILREDFSHIGVGMAVGTDGKVVFTQLFMRGW
ncbi:MAG: CAP domain-containing protein [Chloroflexota bacterium]